MKTDVSVKMMLAVNRVSKTQYEPIDFHVFIHCEDSVSDYWGIWSHQCDECYVVVRHGDEYCAYECKDHTHVRYMMMRIAF